MQLRSLFSLSLALALMGLAQAAPQKVALKSIKTLTFSADQKTAARRTTPIPQLTCKGPVCSGYRQYVSVVQCSNMGDDGSGNIQWKCQADLPSALRLGKVEVSCEGWSRAGDSNVLQGSCGLEYNLIRVPTESDPSGHRGSSWDADSVISTLFSCLFISVAAFIAYSFLHSCLFPPTHPRSPPRPPPGSGPGGPGFYSGGGGGGGDNPDSPPPPPYDAPGSGPAPPSTKPSSGGGPGLLTGLGLGGLAAYLATRNRGGNNQPRQQVPYRYGGFGFEDREDDVLGHGRQWGRGPTGGDGVAGPSRGRGGGGGSGGLGEVRTSTGFGGSTTR